MASLLTAAAALFVEKGYDATTMTEIAGRAGAAIGSLYLFFPTKPALAQALLTDLAENLSGRLDELRSNTAGQPAAAIADAVFNELSQFLAEHPVYGALIDLPGDGDWRSAVRARRRTQIAALFAQAKPPLPAGQSERLALIMPQLIRFAAVLSGEVPPIGDGVLDEMRAMLRHHLMWPDAPQASGNHVPSKR